jgi:hypothetical protein
VKICYLLTTHEKNLIEELRKYFLVVNCRINNAMDVLGISMNDVEVINFKESTLLNSEKVEDQIKKLYSGCPTPGVSKIFRSGSQKWSTILKLEV